MFLPVVFALAATSSSPIGYDSVESALAGLRQTPGARFRVEQGWTIVEVENDGSGSSVWSFTPDKHPAHPAVVKRTIYEADGKVMMRTSAICGAKKDACDQLMEQFEALKEKMRHSMEHGS